LKEGIGKITGKRLGRKTATYYRIFVVDRH